MIKLKRRINEAMPKHKFTSDDTMQEYYGT